LKEDSKRNLLRRKRIAELAVNLDGSSKWQFDKRKDNFPANSNKCNKFVYDVVKNVGADPGLINQGWPPRAGDWANPKLKIRNWRVLYIVELPQSGDIGAYKLAGGGARFSGHSGIIVDNGDISAHDDRVGPIRHQFNPPLDSPGEHNIVYRRYIGE
jgi:hypothetical protein